MVSGSSNSHAKDQEMDVTINRIISIASATLHKLQGRESAEEHLKRNQSCFTGKGTWTLIYMF